jgi:putative Mg2+ transporter-C (MgtC) family protein
VHAPALASALAPPLALIPSQANLSGRLVLAALLGGAIGLEREVSEHPAGLRTHMAVALGAALFGVLSAYGFTEFLSRHPPPAARVDVTRIASQVVVGVGFLGGGAILKEGGSVRGLTTAASLWVTSAIGLAVGVGSLVPAVVTTAIVLLSLVYLQQPARWLARRVGSRTRRLTVILRVARGADTAEVVRALRETPGIDVTAVTIREREGGTTIRAEMQARHGLDVERVIEDLAARHGLEGFDLG